MYSVNKNKILSLYKVLLFSVTKLRRIKFQMVVAETELDCAGRWFFWFSRGETSKAKKSPTKLRFTILLNRGEDQKQKNLSSRFCCIKYQVKA